MTPASNSPRGLAWFLPRIGLALGALLVALAVAELAARLYLGERFVSGLPVGRPDKALAQHDPDLGWVNLPGANSWVEAPRFAYRAEINSKGLRDREHAYEKPAGVTRVALLGDSIAWGWGVDNGRCFADLVEEQLPGVEVINLGVPGYSTDQQLWALEKEGLRYQPDLVLLCFVLNDVVGNGLEHSQGRNKPCFERRDGAWQRVGWPAPPAEPDDDGVDPAGLLQRVYWHSALLQAASPPDPEGSLADSAPTGPAAGERERTDGQPLAPGRREGAAKIEALCDEVRRKDSVTYMLLGRLREACAARGLPLVAFNVAHHHDQYLYFPNVPRQERWNDQPFHTRLSRNLLHAAQALGFHAFSVDDAMYDETAAGQVLTCGDGHLNERGNQVVAARIIEELKPILEQLRQGTYTPPEPRVE